MIDDAPETVADLTARAITPAACEMLDGWTLRAIEDFVHAGFPRDSAAVLLIEIEGLTEAVEAQAAQVIEICNLHHAREVRLATTPTSATCFGRAARTLLARSAVFRPAITSRTV